MEIDFIELTKKYPFPEKRPRHHVAPYLYIPFSQLKVVPDNYPKPISELNWSTVFKNGAPPIYLDIGTGRGKFILEMGSAFPNKNILGIEIRKNCVDWLRNIVIQENIENVGILWYNVMNGLEFIENDSLEAIFYLFPDPWPKSKHAKRRALNNETLKDICNKIARGGNIYFATDVEEIHTYHLELLRNTPNLTYSEVPNFFDWKLPKTNKEVSCIRRSKIYYKIIAEKI